MRRLSAFALAATLTAFGVGSVAAGSSPFTGSWESIDTDGSYQVMTISAAGPDGRTRLALFDSFGTVCVNVGGTSTTFHGIADAWTDGNDLYFEWRHVGCGNVEAFYALGTGLLQYDASGDVVHDSFGLTWTRIANR